MSSKIVIIGAGPVGLSIAAHLRARDIGFRIFGKPMHNWQARMPRGMLLKSEGFASNLADPNDRFSLEAFCSEQGLPYAPEGLPVPREDFIAYGRAFQQRFAPDVEEREVVAIRRSGGRFAVQLDDGELLAADKIVVGIGISDFYYLPPSLADLPAELVTHSSRHEDMAAFRGRRVIVVGSGSSAIDIAALLHENGAAVQIVSRRSELPFHSPPEESRSLVDVLRAPRTGIGPGWRSVFYTQAPSLFYRLPADLRMRIVSTWLGPAGGWYMRERVVGKVPCLAAHSLQSAQVGDGQVHLRLAGANGVDRVLSADHIIAATGYRVDFGTVEFLDQALRADLLTASGYPVLSRNFETSIAGLYIVGPAAAYSFGPMFRFVLGARFTARRLARHLAGASMRLPSAQRAAVAAR